MPQGAWCFLVGYCRANKLIIERYAFFGGVALPLEIWQASFASSWNLQLGAPAHDLTYFIVGGVVVFLEGTLYFLVFQYISTIHFSFSSRKNFTQQQMGNA